MQFARDGRNDIISQLRWIFSPVYIVHKFITVYACIRRMYTEIVDPAVGRCHCSLSNHIFLGICILNPIRKEEQFITLPIRRCRRYISSYERKSLIRRFKQKFCCVQKKYNSIISRCFLSSSSASMHRLVALSFFSSSANLSLMVI